MRIARPLLFAIAILAASLSPGVAAAAQYGGSQPDSGQLSGGQLSDIQPGATTVVTESPLPSAAIGGGAGDCGCRTGQPQQSWQQPPWHGNVRGNQCGAVSACCRGSNVYQAHPFQQLQQKHSGCVTLPPCLPRLHALCREGRLPSPIPPVQPHCHQCGAAIEGGF